MKQFAIASLCLMFFAPMSVLMASTESIGPKGINSINLMLTGNGIDIGQVEFLRPGSKNVDDAPAAAALYHTAVTPADVFTRHVNNVNFVATANNGAEINAHAVEVAGVIISTDPTAQGVATQAQLFSVGINPTGSPPTAEDIYAQTAVSAQYIATLANHDVLAINMSIAVGPNNASPNGGSTLTEFVDWSASEHDVLYVIAGYETNSSGPLPGDHFNGITVGTSEKKDGVFRQVDSSNILISDGTRPLVDLIAPGRDVVLTDPGSTLTQSPHPYGTSVAAPHVTGTVALLQQYAAANMVGNLNAKHHQVMKAVLLNSADKIQGIIGMDRTVLLQHVEGQPDKNWFNTSAASSPFISLDEQMGAGELDAKRAVQQFSSGQFAPGAVPLIGWDFNGIVDTAPTNKYLFNQTLQAGNYVSITLDWDRHVNLDAQTEPFSVYKPGDQFIDNGFFNVDLYLMPAGATNLNQAVASSKSTNDNVEHIFASVQTAGNYEIWVQLNDDRLFAGEEYALAWWAGADMSHASIGDYNGNGVVDAQDYTAWRGAYGTTSASADGNGDGVVNTGDYVI